MNARGVVVVLALCMFTCSMSVAAAADGWWPKLSDGKSTSSAASKKSDSSSGWPWSSSSKPKPKARSKKPSTFGKMTKSTKSAWNKTVDFLNPFDDPKPATKSASPADSSRTGSWFSSPQPVDKPASLSEWMSGEMPKF